MGPVDDMQLINLAKSGNARAMEGLFETYYMTVYRLAYKWCGVKEDAEDIAQEVFIKLVKKLNTFTQNSSFKTWLYRIVINTAKDFARQRAAKWAYESAFVKQQRSTNPGHIEKDRLITIRLFAEIHKLPEKQKEALLLVFGEGLSHKEAAQTIGCAETTVSWRIYQARKKLKKFRELEI